VVFAIHRDVIMYFQECLRAYNPVVVWGGTPPEKKQRFIEKFMYNPRCRIFIGNINAAGTGIDGLQGSCSEVLFLEASWTPASNAQAIMRVHRIGQKNPVRVRFLALAGSIDEKIQTALRRKTAMVDEILG
jgi:SWI/SNF-related matrix-associated actin-dependent regulator 1 of chromatin subfamily A